MAAPDRHDMPEAIIFNSSYICEIEATVTSGFETVSCEEVKEKLGVESTSTRGHVYFFLPVEDVQKTLDLMSIENLYVIIKRYPDMGLSKNLDDDLARFCDIVPELDWSLGLHVWSNFHTFTHPISAIPLSAEQIQNLRAEYPDLPSDNRILHRRPHYSFLPRFRATCHRTGQNHSFSSEQVAKEFGGQINDYFNWGVDMENFDVEVVVTVIDEAVRVSIALTKESRFKRNITKFGPTTLKPTIAYSLLRLCNIEDGDVVCDPMCGGGSIPIEEGEFCPTDQAHPLNQARDATSFEYFPRWGALNWPSAHHICGDIHDLAWKRTLDNMQHVSRNRVHKNRPPLNMSVFRWDSCNLPLRDGCVDVMTTDLPFGKRSGSKVRNTVLYPRALTEMARVTRLSSGRACLLTYDKKCLHKTLLSLSHYWKWTATVGINIGGLAAAAFILNRTCEKWKGPWSQSKRKLMKKQTATDD